MEEVGVVGDVAAEAGQLDGRGRGRHSHARAARVAPQALLHGQLVTNLCLVTGGHNMVNWDLFLAHHRGPKPFCARNRVHAESCMIHSKFALEVSSRQKFLLEFALFSPFSWS